MFVVLFSVNKCLWSFELLRLRPLDLLMFSLQLSVIQCLLKDFNHLVNQTKQHSLIHGNTNTLRLIVSEQDNDES